MLISFAALKFRTFSQPKKSEHSRDTKILYSFEYAVSIAFKILKKTTPILKKTNEKANIEISTNYAVSIASKIPPKNRRRPTSVSSSPRTAPLKPQPRRWRSGNHHCLKPVNGTPKSRVGSNPREALFRKSSTEISTTRSQ